MIEKAMIGLIILILIGIVVVLYLVIRRELNKKTYDLALYEQKLAAILNATNDKVAVMSQTLDKTSSTLEDVPSKVFNMIKGSNHTLRGELGEFIQYTRLKADYDTIIPLGDVVDYLCIKFPRPESGVDGSIDFVEVKTNKARLTMSQKAVRSLVADKKVGWKNVKIQMSGQECQQDENDSIG